MKAMELRADDQHIKWRTRTVQLIAAVALLRLVYAWIVPLDLVHDEAYYWDWSRHLDWGYYSKPPMVAWLIALSTHLGGSTAFFVRLPAVVLGTAGLAWLYLLATRMYGRRAGFWTVCIAAATPGNAALSLLMTIDAPLLFCWGGALYFLWRYLDGAETSRATGSWQQAGFLFGATLMTGLGLLSKQTMIGFLMLAVFFCLVSHRDRKMLVRPSFWIWIAGSVVFLAPVLWWNMQHEWITLQHTEGHFSGETVSLSRRLIRLGEFLGGQFGVVSPVTCFWASITLVAAALALNRLGRKEKYLFCFSAVPLAAITVLAFRQRIEPNWPAPCYLAAVVLFVGAALQKTTFSFPRRLEIRPNVLRHAAWVGAATVAITYLVPFGWGLEGSKLDPAVRLRGWGDLAEAVWERWSQLPRADQTFLLVTTGRAEASELAFYLPSQPRAYLWNGDDVVRCQYDLWPGPQEKRSWDALIVTRAGESPPSELRAAFAQLTDCGPVTVPVGNARELKYHLWYGQYYDGTADTSENIAGSGKRLRR